MISKESIEYIRGVLYENLEFHMDGDELIEPIIQDLERLKMLEEENKKLKQAIDILKRFNFTIFNTKDNNNELAFRIYTDSLLETQPLNKQEYNLLKEVLDNE